MRPDHLFFLFVVLSLVFSVVLGRTTRNGPKMIVKILTIASMAGVVVSVVLCILEIKKHA